MGAGSADFVKLDGLVVLNRSKGIDSYVGLPFLYYGYRINRGRTALSPQFAGAEGKSGVAGEQAGSVRGTDVKSAMGLGLSCLYLKKGGARTSREV